MPLVPLTTMDPAASATALGEVCTTFGCMPVETLVSTVVLSCSTLVAFLVGLSYLSAARDDVGEERRRVSAELAAFDRFADAVAAADPEPPGQAAGQTGTTVLLDPGDDGLSTIRQAYRRTVMSVDHFEEDYDEPLPEHMRQEFGPDVATAVVNGPAFTPNVQRALVGAANSACEDRQSLISELDDEDESLATTAATLETVDAGLEDVREESRIAGFEVLVDRWRRLGGLEASIVEAIGDRRRSLAERDAFDLAVYLYEDLPVPEPVLADGASLVEDVREERRRTSHMIGRVV
jgi:hypothetical protein